MSKLITPNKKYSLLLIVLFSINISLNAQENIVTIEDQITDSLHIDVKYYKLSKMQVLPTKKLLRAKIEIQATINKELDSLEFFFNDNFKILESSFNNTVVIAKQINNKIIIKPDSSIAINTPFKVNFSYYCTYKHQDLWDTSLEKDNFYFSNRNTSLLFPTLGDQRERALIEIDAVIPEDYKIIAFDQAVKTPQKNRYRIKSSGRVVLSNFSFNIVKDYSEFNNTFSRVKLHQYTPIDSAIIFKDLLKQIPEQITYLDSIIGPYPYKDFNVLITGKNEKFRLKYFRKGIIIPYEYYQDSVLAEKVILSSLCSQWFGNKTSPESEKDLWITSGLARYIEWLWLERKHGKLVFSKMISAKKVELDKYLGFTDWRSINPYPMYTYDLKVAPLDFELITENIIQTKTELDFLYKTLSIVPDSLDSEERLSFSNRFLRDINDPFEPVYSYHDIIKWAKEQKQDTFRISLDAFYTLSSLTDNQFITYDIILTNPGELRSPVKINLLKDKSALFIHYIRIYYGDEIFFQFFNKFIRSISGESIETKDAIKTILEDSNGELKEIMELWINTNEQIPFFRVKEEI